jgi:predicted glycosyltransferase
VNLPSVATSKPVVTSKPVNGVSPERVFYRNGKRGQGHARSGHSSLDPWRRGRFTTKGHRYLSVSLALSQILASRVRILPPLRTSARTHLQTSVVYAFTTFHYISGSYPPGPGISLLGQFARKVGVMLKSSSNPLGVVNLWLRSRLQKRAKHETRPTILFHPANRTGLGHLNRLSAIALALRQIDESIRTPFVVDGASHVLLDVLGLPHLPLPSRYDMLDAPTACWRAWPEAHRLAVSNEISRAIIGSIKPNVMVIDCFPARALVWAALERDVPIVLCLREMKNLDRYMADMSDLFPHMTLILAPHEAGAFQLPESVRAKSCFVGRIVRPIGAVQSNHQDPERPRIVISGGGGGYPGTVEFYNLALKALSEVRRSYPKSEGRLITGPLFKDWYQLNIVNGVSVVPFDPDSIGTFAAADLVICQSGYNTVTELEQVRTKAILVPAERMSDDQFARANRAAKQNPNFRIFEGSEASELAHLTVEFLKRPVTPLPCGMPTGAMRAAEKLCVLLKES